MMIDKQSRRMGRHMLQVYRELDPHAEQSATKMHATCTKGCGACCRLLVLVTLPEAVAIAEHVLTDPEWRIQLPELLRKLSAQLADYADPATTTSASHAAKTRPCVFLDANNACRIYDVRPAACRYHYVVTDPANCAHGAVDSITGRIDLEQLKTKVLAEAVRILRKASFENLLAAPLPVIMSAVLTILTNGIQLQRLESHQVLSIDPWLHVNREGSQS